MPRAALLLPWALAAAFACGGEAPPANTDTASPADAIHADLASPSDLAAPDAPSPPAPLGMALPRDGIVRVGVAEVDLTPEVLETFTDLDGDATFDGCLDDPLAAAPGCDEPFDDVDGDGHFDAVWIAGFGQGRAARSVHDRILLRTIVITRDADYLVLSALDAIGLLQPRIDEARDRLVAEDALDPERHLVASSHTHQGPDVFGYWGPLDLERGLISPGFDLDYQARVVDALVTSARAAAAHLAPAEIVMGEVDLAARSPWFNGRHFGGTNPQDHVHGLIRDGRDPVLASTTVFALHARTPGTTDGIATIVNFSGHPETWGSDNDALSADYVGVVRDRVDAALGGLTLFVPECLGGMQSMLGAPIPAVDAAGAWRLQESGEPVWATPDTWEFVHAAGVHVADAALAALSDAAPVPLEPFEVRREPLRLTVDTLAWTLGATLGFADYDPALFLTDPAACPDAGSGPGCLDTWVWRLRLGPLALLTAPGELLPELFHGFPPDPRFASERTDPTARGRERDAAYFPQHPPACDAVAWADCALALSRGDCDCLAMHAVPYRLADDPSVPPLVDLLPDDARYRRLFGATGGFFAYIVPTPDFHRAVTLLSPRDGDHYEDTVSASSTLATRVQAAHLRLHAAATSDAPTPRRAGAEAPR